MTVGIDARWLLAQDISPHAALIGTLLHVNRRRPYPARFVLYSDTEPAVAATGYGPNVSIRVRPHAPQRNTPLRDSSWLNFGLPRLAREDSLDLFLSPFYKIPLLLPGIPRVNMIHDLSMFVLPDELLPARHASAARRWCLKSLMKMYCANTICTVTVSEYSKRCLERVLGLPGGRVKVCPNGVDEMPPPASSGTTTQEFGPLRLQGGLLPPGYFLFIGSNIKKKNIEGLIRAYALLPEDRRAQAPLVLRTTPGEWLGEAPALKARQHLVVLGEHLSNREMAALIGHAKALVLLSFDEGFGIPVAEAMAAGVPVIVSSGGALEEVVESAGLVVDPANAEDAARAMTRILDTSEEEYRQMSKRCRERGRAFSSERAADRLFEVLGQITEDLSQRRRDGRRAA